MNSLRLTRIKAFKDTGDIKLAPLTLFVGRNSCGKSSFIRFPVVLGQTLQGSPTMPIRFNCLQSGSVDYGTVDDVIHNQEGDTFSFSYSYVDRYSKIINSIPDQFGTDHYRQLSSILFADKYNSDVEIYLTIVYKKTGIDFAKVQEIHLKLSDQNFCDISFTDECTAHIDLKRAIIEGKFIDFNVQFDVPLKASDRFKHFIPLFSTDYLCKKAIYTQLTGMVCSIDADPEIVKQVNAFCTDPFETSAHSIGQQCAFLFFLLLQGVLWCSYANLEKTTGDVHYLGPIRQVPERIYRVDSSELKNVGATGEKAPQILYDDFKNGGELIKETSEWLSVIIGYTIKINEVGHGYFQLMLEDCKTHHTANIVDVGYGISQVVPLVIQLSLLLLARKKQVEIISEKGLPTADNARLITKYARQVLNMHIIEQPELHLHPAAQSKFAALVCEAIRSIDHSSVPNVLIETHSEHLIRSIQIKIADPEDPLTADMVKVYYIDHNENGDTVINEMKLTEYGQFTERWPSGFFDETSIQSVTLLKYVTQQKGRDRK